MRWRVLVGPAVVLLTVGAVAFVNRDGPALPNPAPIFIWAVVFAAYLGGIVSGLIGTAIALAYAAYWLAEPGQPFVYGPEGLSRLLILSVVAPAIALTVGLLNARAERALAHERAARRDIETAHRDAARLRAALDQVDYGVVLLDEELRAQFINRAFRRIWHLSDEKAESRPAFVGLMYHARDNQAYAMAPEDLDSFIASRVAHVRLGEPAPLDLRLANGSVIRFRCAALPDGGRLLTYIDVSDFVHQSEELERIATLDGLTGIPNRRHFIEAAEMEWVRARRYGRPLALLMLDVDAFKAINDRFGHETGDHVIAHVAEVCRDAKRTSDTVARLGGDEFALMLPETTGEQALVVAERIRQTIGARAFFTGGHVVDATVSIGVAESTPHIADIAALMRAADDALYAAKRGGRNRIAQASDPSADVFARRTA